MDPPGSLARMDVDCAEAPAATSQERRGLVSRFVRVENGKEAAGVRLSGDVRKKRRPDPSVASARSHEDPRGKAEGGRVVSGQFSPPLGVLASEFLV